ncbi:MAG: hypothetical protein U0X92_10285 [Anaerolineales bacterium]
MTTFDLNILPIYRINGQESADLPGLLALTPARKAARGREKDSLIMYLMLSGNASYSIAELAQINHNAGDVFYQTPGSLTSAMRKTAEHINTALLERNLSTSGRGQYALGLLALAVMRESQITLLLSGPAHAIWVSEGQSRHIYDPALSGKVWVRAKPRNLIFHKLKFIPTICSCCAENSQPIGKPTCSANVRLPRSMRRIAS